MTPCHTLPPFKWQSAVLQCGSIQLREAVPRSSRLRSQVQLNHAAIDPHGLQEKVKAYQGLRRPSRPGLCC